MKSSLLTLVDIANGLPVAMCDAFSLGQNEGSQGESARTAALVALTTNPVVMQASFDIVQATEAQSDILVDKLSERLLVEPLGSINGDGKTVAAASASASVALTSTTKRVSISAFGADIFVSIGDSEVTAATSKNIIFAGTWKDFTCAEGSYIAAKRVGAVDGTAYITEFTSP